MDDVTSAQQMFAAYCAMVDGTTSFPEPPLPPGDGKDLRICPRALRRFKKTDKTSSDLLDHRLAPVQLPGSLCAIRSALGGTSC
jgi:hypothetical protein